MLWDRLIKGNQLVLSLTYFLSFHAVKNFTTAEGGSATWKANPTIDDVLVNQGNGPIVPKPSEANDICHIALVGWCDDIVFP